MTDERITLSNARLSARFLARGARLSAVHLDGDSRSLTLGPESAAACVGGMRCAGAICGPVVNRISGGTFRIGDVTYTTEQNEGRNTLHGGSQGTDVLDWEVAEATEAAITFTLHLPDGHGGFPGNRDLTARWQLSGPTILDLTLHATTDQTTPMNLAHHPYWCLDKAGGDTLRVAADRYMPGNDETLPTGEVVEVTGTPYDFRTGRRLWQADVPYLDNNFCLSHTRVTRRPVAEVAGANGVRLDIESSEPGLQVYSGLGSKPGDEQPDGRFIALEPQFWPDALNNPDFPSILLEPGKAYRQDTRYVFSTSRGA